MKKKIKIKQRSIVTLNAILHCKGGSMKDKRKRKFLEIKRKSILESLNY